MTTLAELAPHLVTLAVGLLGGSGLAALIKARPERSHIYLLGAESAVKSLEAALAAADADNAELRAELAGVKAELATERAARTELERRLARLERAAE